MAAPARVGEAVGVRNPRTDGPAPRSVAVVHGGPGAAGDVAAVARELGRRRGVLEPLQTARTVAGQVTELASLLRSHGRPPFTLIGHSWGAWLVLLTAAEHPGLAAKLVLVGCGPLETRWLPDLERARRERLSPADRREFDAILARLGDPAVSDRDAALARLGALCGATDDFDPLPEDPEDDGAGAPDGDLFHRVWSEAAARRESGALLDAVGRIDVPVLAIHGEHDPHPVAGVREPLTRAVTDFRLVLLPRCGHSPWRERQARDPFFRLLELVLGEP